MIGVVLAAAASLVSAQPAPEPIPAPPIATPPPVEAPPVEAPPVEITPPARQIEAPPEPPAKVEPPKPIPPPVPMKRVRAPAAVIQAIDKVTARSIRFVAPVGKPVRYQNLVFTVRACEMSAPDEPQPDSFAYIVVDSQPRQPGAAARQVYRGWMFANSPGLHPLEHPVYDAWLISCSAAPPATPAAKR